MRRVGYELTNPVFQQAKTVHVLDRTATLIGNGTVYTTIILGEKTNYYRSRKSDKTNFFYRCESASTLKICTSVGRCTYQTAWQPKALCQDNSLVNVAEGIGGGLF
jgi:hypothetical protein